MISIYLGKGADQQIRSVFPKSLFLSAKQLIHTDWDQTSKILIMPGGRDCPYHEALQGAGNQKIRSFVERGGLYLGICAGAYYGCAEVDFDRGMPLEVVEKRGLCFFEGSGFGPAYGKGSFDYASQKGARAARIQGLGMDFGVYYNGGCTFLGDALSFCQIIACYADLPSKPPAIIECKIGKGRVILSGVHIETQAKRLDPLDPFLAPIIPRLEASEPQRRIFLEKLLSSHLP